MGQMFTYIQPTKTDIIGESKLKSLLSESKYTVALTGAGVSAESNIPTFRDPGDGLWQRYDPMTYATIWGYKRHPEKIWELLRDFLQVVIVIKRFLSTLRRTIRSQTAATSL
eukprot:GHVN01073329.1.p2 GENE.GHVN01073329.1~~GHVN01073329.1.p2  ORF type:complete len:112 (-),score=3.16 GHVN01073329.1:732-1067(-)